MPTDNSYLTIKKNIRREAVARVYKADPFVIETHAGQGIMRRACYPIDRGILCEICPRKTASLAQRFPRLAVFKGDSRILLAAHSLGPQVPDIVDIDAYGSPWKHLEIALAAPWLPDVICFVVTDGLIHKAKRGLSYTDPELQAAALQYGNGYVKANYRAFVEEQLIAKSEEAGRTLDLFAFRQTENVSYYAFISRKTGSPAPVKT